MNVRCSPPEVMERLLSPEVCCGVVQVIGGRRLEKEFDAFEVEFVCWLQAAMLSNIMSERIGLEILIR